MDKNWRRHLWISQKTLHRHLLSHSQRIVHYYHASKEHACKIRHSTWDNGFKFEANSKYLPRIGISNMAHPGLFIHNPMVLWKTPYKSVKRNPKKAMKSYQSPYQLILAPRITPFNDAPSPATQLLGRNLPTTCLISNIIINMCPRGVMVKAMNCGIVVREFVLQSRYYVHFRANTLGKGMNLHILPPAMGK